MIKLGIIKILLIFVLLVSCNYKADQLFNCECVQVSNGMKNVLSDFSLELDQNELIQVSSKENIVGLTYSLNPEKVRFDIKPLKSKYFCKRKGRYILFYPNKDRMTEGEIVYTNTCDKPQRILENKFNNIEFVDYDPPIWYVVITEDSLNVYDFVISDTTKIKSYER